MRILITLAAFFLVCSLHAQEPATLVLLNGQIVTVDDAIGTVEAIAARGDRIVFTGSNAEVRALIGEHTEVIDLNGRLAIPGFIEGHGHFTGLGQAKMNLDLMRVRNWNEVIEMVADAVSKAQPGEWIVGRGWHQEKWDRVPDGAVEGFPTHHALSAVSPENPVFLTHASGHASFANAKAMEIAGVSGESEDPEGGEILRDLNGQPIGIFRETASGLIARVAATGGASMRERAAQMERIVELAEEECLRKGVTSFQDAGSSFFEAEYLANEAEAGELDVRIWMMIREPNDRMRQHLHEVASLHRVGANVFTVGGIKRSIDGALGSRGAWLLEPYADAPESTGLNTATIEDVTDAATIAFEHGLQMCVHAIGDRANREVLDIYEKIFQSHEVDAADLRWRIEHAQHLHPDDIPRFAGLGVIASMQGVHCTSDAPWVYARLGDERAESGAYVWRNLLDSGAVVTNGTDAPVEDVDPIMSFYASVARTLKDGSRFFPGQCMTRMEALRSYTLDCAWAAKEDDIKGSLTPGKLADIVVLSQDILAIPAEQIPATKVDLTIVGGEVKFRRQREE